MVATLCPGADDQVIVQGVDHVIQHVVPGVMLG